ncbi:hypothetical protein V6N11_078467 [Hibiscus sabdariffa]|uniref:Uncharacterized protein n=1 Tax=Hibiscus sabdariffa TaxID=183260 RepID=A0ABR2TG40_9ROSI
MNSYQNHRKETLEAAAAFIGQRFLINRQTAFLKEDLGSERTNFQTRTKCQNRKNDNRIDMEKEQLKIKGKKKRKAGSGDSRRSRSRRKESCSNLQNE